MRPAPFVCLSIACLAACSEPDTQAVFAQVGWMEWPAEVLAGKSFSVRLVGYGATCGAVRFDPGTTVDNSAVTFEPFFLVPNHAVICPVEGQVTRPVALPPIWPFFDHQAPIGGLAAQYPRTYEVRAAANVSAPAVADASLPVRTFGEIVVRNDSIDASHTNAAGQVTAIRDSTGCVEIYALGPLTAYLVENPPADTATYWYAFVQGYIYRPAKPVCGDSVVFHLVTRN
jgi:hypothetical protein